LAGRGDVGDLNLEVGSVSLEDLYLVMVDEERVARLQNVGVGAGGLMVAEDGPGSSFVSEAACRGGVTAGIWALVDGVDGDAFLGEPGVVVLADSDVEGGEGSPVMGGENHEL
jgi:hypothetical protein